VAETPDGFQIKRIPTKIIIWTFIF